ncbi:hypothetical protein ACFFX1_51625 [Dactylosporangium sucinum]|uniref:Uncharacterized protein n=1 Tax=Dactylosporangium sucinum TaxID=1424081 RepID=A0A917U6P5_9ACTN|nr:hypothetical protein [Dactylosporangium sucinum]GGM58005.1 hypothetical protein GCM10007977_069520 [Dactylosporangium sucinum]
MSLSWWSIEVRDGERPARQWRDAYAAALVESAVTHGARDWAWRFESFGVVLELGFAEEDDWHRFRALPAVVAALDAVEPATLYVYPGRGGSAGAGLPRRRGPFPAAGAAPLPMEPEPPLVARPPLDARPPILVP